MQLQKWFNDNMPDDNLIYGNGMKDQVMWVRDHFAYMVWRSFRKEFDAKGDDYDVHEEKFKTLTVTSTHTSKSVLLPVYEFNMFGTVIKLRGNFHDWCIRCNKPLIKKLPTWLAEPCHDGFFEGMCDEESPIKLCVREREQAYALVWWMLNEGIERS